MDTQPAESPEVLAGLTLTPAIPGGQPFDTPVVLPATLPEPGISLALGLFLAVLTGRGRRRA